MASTADQPASDQDCANVPLQDRTRFWAAVDKLRPEIALAGYWEALQRNCDQWATELSIAPFWKSVRELQPSWSNDFQRKTSGALLAGPQIPDFVGKKVDRIKEKLFQDWLRANRPADVTSFWPSTGPPVPLINDLVRARVECQFLDGVEFLVVDLRS